MAERSREIIALFVFAGLIVLALCGLIGYLFTGHSWNVAASTIDDTFGDMEGYTVIVYAGTIVPEKETEPTPQTSPLSPSAGTEASNGSKSVDASGELRSSAGSNNSEVELSSDVFGDGFVDTSTSADSSSSSTSDGAISTSTPNGTASSSSEGQDSSTSSTTKVVSVAEARASYVDKNATVFSLDTTALEKYTEGVILKNGGHRFGVFSVLNRMSSLDLARQIAYFQTHKVDFIMVLTTNRQFVSEAEGIDIVISTQDEGLLVMGETAGGTFYVDAPEIGKVGTILISPNNVVSAKVIEEL